MIFLQNKPSLLVFPWLQFHHLFFPLHLPFLVFLIPPLFYLMLRHFFSFFFSLYSWPLFNLPSFTPFFNPPSFSLLLFIFIIQYLHFTFLFSTLNSPQLLHLLPFSSILSLLVTTPFTSFSSVLLGPSPVIHLDFKFLTSLSYLSPFFLNNYLCPSSFNCKF